MGDTYKCARCKETFTKGRSDQESMVETKALFGEDTKIEECDVVCDDCFKIIVRMN